MLSTSQWLGDHRPAGYGTVLQPISSPRAQCLVVFLSFSLFVFFIGTVFADWYTVGCLPLRYETPGPIWHNSSSFVCICAWRYRLLPVLVCLNNETCFVMVVVIVMALLWSVINSAAAAAFQRHRLCCVGFPGWWHVFTPILWRWWVTANGARCWITRMKADEFQPFGSDRTVNRKQERRRTQSRIVQRLIFEPTCHKGKWRRGIPCTFPTGTAQCGDCRA